MELRLKERFGRLPPPAMLFLHRKLGGLYLLFSHLRAEIRVKDLMAPLLAMPVPGAGEAALPRVA